jgi:hypothetical protein
MMTLKTGRLFAFASLLIFCSCSTIRKAGKEDSTTISSLHFLGERDVPFNKQFNGTTIGGLSGIDYNPERQEYYLICDDRSAINPARFYTAKLQVNERGIDTVIFTAVTNLLQANGSVYPNTKQEPGNTPDPEALRYNKKTNRLIWTSEGERIVGKNKTTVIADPTINVIGLDGNLVDSFPLPEQLHMSSLQKGPRQNGVLEGLAFADDFRSMYLSVEEPLYEDGPRAGLTDTTAWVRIIKYDMDSKQPVAQYAYKLDPVAYPPTPLDAFKVNGIPDILSIGNNKLLVLERSYSTGRLACTIKIYLTDLGDASNISINASLIANPPNKPATKQLLLNMDSLGIYIDNIEGVTFGPTLPNGHKTLIFIADNNFSDDEVTQFLLFEVEPGRRG